MTFLQIEIENNDPNSLINQVEYQAYDENKQPYDLSICDDVNIQVAYFPEFRPPSRQAVRGGWGYNSGNF